MKYFCFSFFLCFLSGSALATKQNLREVVDALPVDCWQTITHDLKAKEFLAFSSVNKFFNHQAKCSISTRIDAVKLSDESWHLLQQVLNHSLLNEAIEIRSLATHLNDSESLRKAMIEWIFSDLEGVFTATDREFQTRRELRDRSREFFMGLGLGRGLSPESSATIEGQVDLLLFRRSLFQISEHISEHISDQLEDVVGDFADETFWRRVDRLVKQKAAATEPRDARPDLVGDEVLDYLDYELSEQLLKPLWDQLGQKIEEHFNFRSAVENESFDLVLEDAVDYAFHVYHLSVLTGLCSPQFTKIRSDLLDEIRASHSRLIEKP